MKFLIAVTPDAGGWAVTVLRPNGTGASHHVDRSGSASDGFPVPPTPAAAAPYASLLLGDIEQNLRDAWRDIMLGDPGNGGVERFGSYLTACLLFNELPAIEAEAANGPVELELQFESSDTAMHRLPWEMMYAGQGPLACKLKSPVAIFRRIRGDKATPRMPALPLRLLFVVGRQMDDALRPGAEYVGLLRHLNVQPAGAGGAARSAEVDLRLLLETTPDELEDAVSTFHPDAIHFICHGESGVSGSRILLTRRDPKTKLKTDQPEYCSAKTIFGLITRQDAQGRNVLPQIVVLNACHTATAPATPEEMDAVSQVKASALSFAAELAAAGIPITVGMAGEVADGACRLFTRRFYQALIAQEPVTLATAGGRRAAMLYYKDYDTSVEWARPVLYLADGADSVLQADQGSQDEMFKVVEIAARYREQIRPAGFCDRLQCLQAFQTFAGEAASPAPRKILMFAVTEASGQFGKTRLLEEIAARSVLQGYVPVLRRSTTSDAPSSLLKFALQLAAAMDKARSFFTSKAKKHSAALQMCFDLDDPNRGVVTADDGRFSLLRDKVLRLLEQGTLTAGVEAVRDSMVKDLRALQNDTNGRMPLVLLDDLQSYAGVAPVLLSKDMLDEQYALGENGLTVPLVFTYSTVGTSQHPVMPDAEAAIKKFVKDFDKYIVWCDLNQFSAGPEERLAYCQFLLSCKTPMAMRSRQQPADVDDVFDLLRDVVKGVPSGFEDDGLDGVLKFLNKKRYLVDADDEQILRSIV